MQFHDRTLGLLGSEFLPIHRSIEALKVWAAESDITLPAAYLEWASIDDGSLLRKYSNDDEFWFDEPHLVDVIETPDGACGLWFNEENQGNYKRIVMLNQGDDPPVLFAWIGRPPWVQNTERFSDAVYAQIFDWQYWLKFRAEDPDYREITYYGDINLKTDRCLMPLRERYEEVVSSRYIVDAEHATEYRFMKSLLERITVTVGTDRSAQIRITGEEKLVSDLELELLELFRDDVVQPK